MPRYRRTIEDSLKEMAGSARALAGWTLSTPELQELGGEYLAENSVDTRQLLPGSVTNEQIAIGAVTRDSFDNALNTAVDDLVDGVARIDAEVLPAITDAAASPVTDSRLVEGSLTKWPFQGGTIPAGALAPGAIAGPEISDFALTVKKFKNDRHHLY